LTELEALLEGVDGWCTPHKAEKLHEIALRPDCRLAVEIGIFGGKSLLPVALAFKTKGSGRIFGVEPWDNAVAIETPTSEGNDKWWAEVDLVGVKRRFFEHVRAQALEEQIKVIETPSDAAMLLFLSPRYTNKIDLVHLDGAHSVEQSVTDSAFWLGALRPGGFLVLDDINWPSVSLAWQFLQSVATLVYVSESDEQGHFAVFQKRLPPVPAAAVG
jgi:hypothetical protein